MALYNALNGTSYINVDDVNIPTPKYIVFYNGVEERPAVEKLRLSNAFIHEVQKYKESTNLTEAINRAVDECINEGILKDLLLQHKAEVIELVLTTYNKELHEKYLKEDAREEGLEEGRAEGRAQGIMDSLAAVVQFASSFTSDINYIHAEIVKNEIFKDVTKEQVEEILHNA